MNMSHTLIIRIVAWIACAGLLIALFAYSKVGSMVSDHKAAYAAARDEEAIAETRAIMATRSSALFADTAAARSELEHFAAADVTASASTIEGLSSPSATLLVKGASVVTASSPTESNVHLVDLAIDGNGTFGGLVRALHLIDTIALPITIEQFDLSRGTDPSTPWHLSARVRLRTTTSLAL